MSLDTERADGSCSSCKTQEMRTLFSYRCAQHHLVANMFSVELFRANKFVSVSGSDGRAGSVGADHSMMRD